MHTCIHTCTHANTHTLPSYILFHKQIAVSATLETTSTQDFLKLPDPRPGVPGPLPHSPCYRRYLLSRGRIPGCEPLLPDSLPSGLRVPLSRAQRLVCCPDSSYLSTMQRPVVCTSRGRALGGDGVILMGGGGYYSVRAQEEVWLCVLQAPKEYVPINPSGKWVYGSRESVL